MKRRDKRILEKVTRDVEKDNSLIKKDKKKIIDTTKEIIEIENIKERYSKLYDYICDYLDNEFVSKNICDFKDDTCIRRRALKEKGVVKSTYKNGCCYGYKNEKLCEYLVNGRCTIKNIACKTFICPFLRKKGYKYSINKIYFAKYFFNFRQKLYMENTFFVPKEVVMKGIIKRKSIFL